MAIATIAVAGSMVTVAIAALTGKAIATIVMVGMTALDASTASARTPAVLTGKGYPNDRSRFILMWFRTIESTVKQIGARLKLAGAQWKADHVPQVLLHRCAYLNGQLSLSDL